MHLVYIANTRLPTEKAHGYQICKMCEAFARNGAHVELFHPRRWQPDPKLEQSTVFAYYGIRPIFEVHSLSNVDIVRLNLIIPDRWFAPLFFAHTFLWSLFATLVVRREGAEVYYTRSVAIAYWLTRLGLPTVYEAHAIPKRGNRWLLRRLAGHPSLRLSVALTSFIRKGLIEMGFPANKVVVLPDGVDLSLFADLPSQEICRRKLGLPLDRLIIGYIGRFRTMEMEKGIPELIQAMALLSHPHGAEPLLLCVGGPMDVVPTYLELARKLKVPQQQFRFVDRVPNVEVPCWIKSFDIAVATFPNREHYAYFMSPLKLFEYMAAGVPIVASDLPSIREVLRHGENAWLVEPGAPVELAQSLYTLLENPTLARRLAKQAREDVQAYTWRTRGATILQALDRVG